MVVWLGWPLQKSNGDVQKLNFKVKIGFCNAILYGKNIKNLIDWKNSQLTRDVSLLY